MADLFISDLDGTLLDDTQHIDAETIAVINSLVAQGLWFTIATARSMVTTAPLVEQLDLRLPIITMNGAIIIDPQSGSELVSNYLDATAAQRIIADHFNRGLRPFLYTVDENRKQHVYHLGTANISEDIYVTSRAEAGDNRFRQVTQFDEALLEKVIAVNAMDHYDRLAASAAQYRSGSNTCGHLSADIYAPGFHWLEICHPNANKRDAVLFVKAQLATQRLVCFGDNHNDLPMFEAADESYAVANAQPEVKAAATGIIGSNNEQAVAGYLRERLGQ